MNTPPKTKARLTLANVIAFTVTAVVLSYFENYIASVAWLGMAAFLVLIQSMMDGFRRLLILAQEANDGWKEALEDNKKILQYAPRKRAE